MNFRSEGCMKECQKLTSIKPATSIISVKNDVSAILQKNASDRYSFQDFKVASAKAIPMLMMMPIT